MRMPAWITSNQILFWALARLESREQGLLFGGEADEQPSKSEVRSQKSEVKSQKSESKSPSCGKKRDERGAPGFSF
jgi:hypothetical protein